MSDLYRNVFKKPIRPITSEGTPEDQLEKSVQALRDLETEKGDPVNIRDEEIAEKIKQILRYRKFDEDRAREIVYELDVSDPVGVYILLVKLPEHKAENLLESDIMSDWLTVYGGFNNANKQEDVNIRIELIKERIKKVTALI